MILDPAVSLCLVSGILYHICILYPVSCIHLPICRIKDTGVCHWDQLFTLTRACALSPWDPFGRPTSHQNTTYAKIYWMRSQMYSMQPNATLCSQMPSLCSPYAFPIDSLYNPYTSPIYIHMYIHMTTARDPKQGNNVTVAECDKAEDWKMR